MIISHRHRYIFFAVPKTGTHAVRRALRVHLGEDDLEQVSMIVNKRFPFPALRHINHGHLAVGEIRPVLGEAVFAGYCKFAFVRNPFDRFVSYCAFIGRQGGHFQAAPQRFMKYVLDVLRPTGHLLFRPQSDFLVDAHGDLAMDFIGRTETMQQDYDRIAMRLGFPGSALERVNATTHRPFVEYYDAALAAGVLQQYRRDFELFGYPTTPAA